MSRIDTANKASTLQAQMELSTKSENSAAAAKAGGIRKLWKSRENAENQAKLRSRPFQKLTSVREVLPSDIQPLGRRKRDEVIAELSRLILFLEAENEDGHGDEASQLCKLMLQENIRRLMLVREGQGTPNKLRSAEPCL